MTGKDRKNSPLNNVQDFNSVSIYLASPSDVRSWSCGEVKRSETINYRTLKPENDGLFCARIFGPVRDYECICGKYRRMKYRGVVCEKCGVEVTLSRVRRERMGHIELAAPVVHPWYLRSIPSRIGMILDMSVKTLEQIIYSEKYVVTEPGISDFKERQVLTGDQYAQAQLEQGLESFTAETGSYAILTLLKNVDLKASLAKVKAERAKTSSSIKLRRLVKQARIIEAFIRSGNKPEWMVVTVLPVLPPDLRPLVPLDGGRFATSDLNDLYRRVVIRNNRLRRLQELAAPEIIVRNERRMLQKSVEALFDGNGRVSKTYQGNAKANLKSLSDMLKGKRGRFRQNLLGKRVDYSGRSVIVVGPHLRLHQCGLPKEMALELFKPYIYARLEAEGKAQTLKMAKKLVERGGSEIWNTLEEVVKGHPVILNRAPTLHRLGVQAFEPVLVEGKAIQLHPLVCTAFNADFDGDQMAVHVPLSVEAQTEARVLLMSTNNVLSPANGQPIIVPTQDIVLGIYYMTIGENNAEFNKRKFYRDVAEIKYAIANKKLTVHDQIIFRFAKQNEEGEIVNENIMTTAGRALLSETLPKSAKIGFDLINCALTKGEVANLVNTIYRRCPQQEVVNFCDRIMDFGFKHACTSGISFGKDDMIIPAMKEKLVADTAKLVNVYEKQWFEGLVTKGERRNKTIDAWSTCTDQVEKEMIKELSGDGGTNSVYLMWKSGARGSSAQMKQLAGMRGLMAKPSGEIIETPITSNFREGLNVLEYFNSTHGARKGLADTALKTADSGYLTRRLVDVAQDCVVNKIDCGSEAGTWITSIIEGKITMSTLAERILGRIAAQEICDPSTGKVLITKGQELNEKEVEQIVSSGVDRVKTRSVLFCGCSRGVCAKCYGRDLSRGKIVTIGEAVGTVATQSVGEPGTQLTMRTFHVGGTAQVAEESGVEASRDGSIRITNLLTMRDHNNICLIMSKNSELELLDEKGIKYASYPVPYGAKLYYNDSDEVKKGSLIAEWDPYTIPVITEASGKVNYVNLVEDVTLIKNVDEATGIVSKIVASNASTRSYGLRPEINILDEKGEICKLTSGSLASYGLIKGAVLSVEENQVVKVGSVIARIPRESSKTRDITGGLPRVVELFEARQPSDAAIMARTSGTVYWGGTYKGKQKIIIKSENGYEDVYNIPLACHINAQDLDKVEKGDLLVEGTPVLQDILHILGVGKLADFFIKEVQKVYRLQGVKINDKHIEVILRQMLSKVTILDSGDTDFIPGEQIDREDFLIANKKTVDEGGKTAKAEIILLGITKASLQTKSFISAAAFQETTRVLTDAAIAGRTDRLLGMKENIIIGRLIPAGTGAFTKKYKEEATNAEEAS